MTCPACCNSRAGSGQPRRLVLCQDSTASSLVTDFRSLCGDYCSGPEADVGIPAPTMFDCPAAHLIVVSYFSISYPQYRERRDVSLTLSRPTQKT